jgi:hypothetical protein
MRMKNPTPAPSPRAMTAQPLRLAAAAALCAGALAGCKTDSILEVTDPDVLDVAAYSTPAGAAGLRTGVIADFTQALGSGTVDNFIVVSGNLADELIATDTFDDRLTVNSRQSVEVNPNMETPYRNMHRARAGAARAALILAQTAPTPAAIRGELYALRGFTENYLGELWCSGVPFSVEDGVTTTFGQQETTQQVFQRSIASFDTALTLSADSARFLNLARVGRARALLNLGRYADAAAAVAAVPANFNYSVFTSTNSTRQENGVFTATTQGASRYMIVNNEGRNGLNFLTPADPRTPWAPSTRVAFNNIFTNVPNQLKYTRTSPIVVADGREAELIRLEARLQGGTQADRDAVFAGLNALRAANTPVIPALTAAPTTQAAAVDLLFSERARWMWLTGHRLGDLRRLVRNYQRPVESVFPTGELASPLVGSYGKSTNLTIPFDERNNPNFKGCLPGV